MSSKQRKNKINEVIASLERSIALGNGYRVRVSVLILKGFDLVDLVPLRHMSAERSKAKLSRVLRMPII